jgi:hypothetical protein
MVRRRRRSGCSAEFHLTEKRAAVVNDGPLAALVAGGGLRNASIRAD